MAEPDPAKWTPEEREAWKRDYRAGRPVDLPAFEHEPGECSWCDELRALRDEADAEHDG